MDCERFKSVMGVDFSGAALAGRNAWLAELSILGDRRLQLERLAPVGKLAGSDERSVSCQFLVDRILGPDKTDQVPTLWGIDFPFGLPIELGLGGWASQLDDVEVFAGTAKMYGLRLVETSKQIAGTMHIRRQTDRDAKTPFDCYHYRIIYQTFHGMRDILAKVAKSRRVAVIPFQYAKVAKAMAVVAEACPSSTLKRLELPSRLYKQTQGDAVTPERRQIRRAILAGIASHVDISAKHRRIIMQNLGGDALDAVLAGVGVWGACRREDHRELRKHPRYGDEGFVYF